MTIDAINDPKFDGFDADDRQFLAAFFVKHPKVEENFNKYLDFPPSFRMRVAKTELWDTARAGWVRRGIPNPEAVLEHMSGLAQMVEQYFLPRLALIKQAEPGKAEDAECFARKIILMAAIHDYPEAIATDFTPHDKISEADKDRIERLAARVIFADPARAPHLALIEEYIDQTTPASQLLHDFDKIHACMVAAFYEAQYPEQRTGGVFQTFHDYAMPRLKTDIGRTMLHAMAQQKEEFLTMVARDKENQRAR